MGGKGDAEDIGTIRISALNGAKIGSFNSVRNRPPRTTSCPYQITVAAQMAAVTIHSVSAGHRGVPATAWAVVQHWESPQKPKGTPKTFAVTRYVRLLVDVTASSRSRLGVSR